MKYKVNFFLNEEPVELYVDANKTMLNIIRDELFLTYTPITDECLAAVKAAIEEHGHFRTVYETTAGCTVSCHCGPGTLGVLFVRK